MSDWLIRHHSLCLTLMWVFTIAALAVGSYLAAFHTDMDYFAFLGLVAIPLIPALYLRIVYNRYQQQKKKQR